MYWQLRRAPATSAPSPSIDLGRHSARRAVQAAAVVFGDERHHAAIEVAEIVRQIGVVEVPEALPAKFAVAGKRTLPHEVIAKRSALNFVMISIGSMTLPSVLLNFSRPGLLALAVDEAVPKHHLRRLDPGGHEHRRPQGAVKARDVLADKVNVGRPPFGEFRFIAAVADSREVGEQGVEPDPDGDASTESSRRWARPAVDLVVIAVGQTLLLAALGLVAGAGLFVFGRLLIASLRPQFTIALTAGAVGRAALASLVMALLAAIVPARRLAALEPAVAYRSAS